MSNEFNDVPRYLEETPNLSGEAPQWDVFAPPGNGDDQMYRANHNVGMNYDVMPMPVQIYRSTTYSPGSATQYMRMTFDNGFSAPNYNIDPGIFARPGHEWHGDPGMVYYPPVSGWDIDPGIYTGFDRAHHYQNYYNNGRLFNFNPRAAVMEEVMRNGNWQPGVFYGGDRFIRFDPRQAIMEQMWQSGQYFRPGMQMPGNWNQPWFNDPWMMQYQYWNDPFAYDPRFCNNWQMNQWRQPRYYVPDPRFFAM
ncbi:MAG TPA: hypothetical protein V6D17_12100 [Candidatus Obscuribacterales bacterium]